MKPYRPIFFTLVAIWLKLNDELMCITASPNLNAKKWKSVCRNVGEKLRRPILHAFIIYCVTKLVRIAPPNTLTDSYTEFLPRTQPYLNFKTRTPNSKPYIITLPKHAVLIHWWVVYIILLLCWFTPCFITLLSSSQS